MSEKVLVIHGLDEESRTEVETFLKKIGIEADFLQETREADSGLLKNLESYKDVSLAIVILTDDEVGTIRTEFPRNASLKAIQRVVFSLGLITGLLGADKVLVLHHQRQNFELPCEEDDLVMMPLDKNQSWQFSLVKSLKEKGFAIDANKLL